MAATRTADDIGREPNTTSLRFLCAITTMLALLGLGLAAWPMIASLGPSAEVLVTRTVDLSDIPLGGRRTIYWKGYSIFIAHRTPEEIAIAREYDNNSNIRHAGARHAGVFDRDRVQREDWVVVLGWLGRCRMLGQNPGEDRGVMGGWLRSCTGESFDPSGRSTRAPDVVVTHLRVPPYRFVSDSEIEFGACFPRRC